MANYSQDIKPRVKLLEHHSKKPCLHGQCWGHPPPGVRCKRHLDSSAIVRRYFELKKFRKEKLRQAVAILTEAKSLSETRIEQTLGTYNHTDRTEWRRRFPI